MKTIRIEGVGDVIVRKSARAKRIILKVNSSGQPSITLPKLAPYLLAERFANQHVDWFLKNVSKEPKMVINEGKRVGQSHFLQFIRGNKLSSRVTKNKVSVTVPPGATVLDEAVQVEAKKACIRALRNEAEQTLPRRLHELAQKHGYSYREIRVKAVRTRWGSCSSGRIINLSIWLVQLPAELVEYVICHELTHLNQMHHQTAFWEELAGMIPDYKQRRNTLKQYKPDLI